MTATEGRAGFLLALQERPHILITAWEMPGIGGIGVAARDESTPDIEALIERADAGAYLAKQFGRNRVRASSQKICFKTRSNHCFVMFFLTKLPHPILTKGWFFH
jgi:hypothetical protein